MTWKWQWPHVGANPTTEGVDSEMFDRTDYPYSDTFVREAIQNSLDARLDTSKPARIRFAFHAGEVGSRRAFLEDVFKFREKAGLALPQDWKNGRIKWLTIEDFNTKGLAGSLTNRLEDFWGYWLNFGRSNKDGTGRGGRGIGRITFLIASQTRTVLGLTRRNSDGLSAACGMSILKIMADGDDLRSTHAYLAAGQKGAIFDLHDSIEFKSGMVSAFNFQGYQRADQTSGLALAIMYPHEELTKNGILASAIEHFAPAIMNQSLIVEVDETVLAKDNIQEVASGICSEIRTDAIKQGVERYIDLINEGLNGQVTAIDVADPKAGLGPLRGSQIAKRLQTDADAGKTIALQLKFALERSGVTKQVSLRAVISRTPPGKPAVDRLFREGMSLPEVKAKSSGEFDLIVLVDDVDLATYLNFCEGKAHLDLLESKEIKAKLDEQGYLGRYAIKRFVKSLPAELRTLMTPDVAEPDTHVFDEFFAVEGDDQGKGAGGRAKKKDVPPEPPPPPPPPKPPAFKIERMSNGFRASANPAFGSWPISVAITMAYADGTRSPKWSEFDFKPSDLRWSGNGCQVTFEKNRLQATNCGPDSVIEVVGFDTRRELDTRIRTWKDAQTD